MVLPSNPVDVPTPEISRGEEKRFPEFHCPLSDLNSYLSVCEEGLIDR